MKLNRTIPLLAALFALGLLTACGGAESEPDAAAPPAAAPAPAPESEQPPARPVAETTVPEEPE